MLIDARIIFEMIYEIFLLLVCFPTNSILRFFSANNLKKIILVYTVYCIVYVLYHT